MIDIHAHILPGIDDGAKTLASSVEMVRELASGGVSDVIATPHYMDETIYVSSRRENERLLKALRKELQAAGLGVNVHLGNEIYINDKISELIDAGEATTLNGSKYILVELPMSGEFSGYEDIFADLMINGYKVILAHPERYAAVQKDFAILQDLYGMGVLLQCNFGSLVGKYGKHAKRIVRKLAKDRMIFAFGSDMHHCNGKEYWTVVQKKLHKYYDNESLKRVLVDNPRKIIGD